MEFENTKVVESVHERGHVAVALFVMMQDKSFFNYDSNQTIDEYIAGMCKNSYTCKVYTHDEFLKKEASSVLLEISSQDYYDAIQQSYYDRSQQFALIGNSNPNTKSRYPYVLFYLGEYYGVTRNVSDRYLIQLLDVYQQTKATV